MSHYAHIVAAVLDTFDVPKSLTRQVDYGPIGSWPPRPGCGKCLDLALARTWARIDLAQWLNEAPQAFGPHRDSELAALAAVGAQLRNSGEGAQVLWAIDVIPPEQWVEQVHSPALAVAEMVCVGPHLPDSVISTVDAALSSIGWTYPTDVDANQPCTVNHVPCFHSTWHDGLTLSENPTATFSPQQN